MMKKILWISALATLLVSTGCLSYRAPVMPPFGLLFQSTSAPLDTDMNQTQTNPKRGRSSCIAILGLFAFGDCSINEAARQGNLQVIHYADYSYLNIIGIMQSFEVKVYGE